MSYDTVNRVQSRYKGREGREGERRRRGAGEQGVR